MKSPSSKKLQILVRIEKEILALALEKKTRSELAKVLHKSKNFFTLWDKGKAYLHWSDFLTIAKLTKLPLAQALYDMYEFNDSLKHIHTLLFRFFHSDTRILEMARVLNISRSSVTRILSGQQELRLMQFLQIIQSQQGLELLCEALGLEEVFLGQFKRTFESESIRLNKEYPEFSMIADCRDIGVQDVVNHLTKWLPTSEIQLTSLLDKLENLKSLPHDPSQATSAIGVPGNKDFVLKHGTFVLDVVRKDLQNYYNGIETRRLFTFNNYACSLAAREKIRCALSKAVHEVNLILFEDEKNKKECIATNLICLVALDDNPS